MIGIASNSVGNGIVIPNGSDVIGKGNDVFGINSDNIRYNTNVLSMAPGRFFDGRFFEGHFFDP